MKRDVELSREILAFVEQYAPPEGGLRKPLQIEGYDFGTVMAHAELLIEDGLLDGRVIHGLGSPPVAHIIKLTSRGHDAIAAAKSDTIWSKAKKAAVDRGLPYTFDVVLQLAKHEVNRLLGLLP